MLLFNIPPFLGMNWTPWCVFIVAVMALDIQRSTWSRECPEAVTSPLCLADCLFSVHPCESTPCIHSPATMR